MNLLTTPTKGEDLISRPRDLYIDGAWVAPSSDATLKVYSPHTEEVFLEVAEAREADVNRAVDAARRAFDQGPWRKLSPKDRATYLRKLGDGLALRAKDQAEIWPNEMGALHSVAQAMLTGISAGYHKYADMADTFAFEELRTPDQPGITGIVTREPVGVVAAIVPWNVPAFLIAHKLAPALLAGCTVIIKASPEAPGMAYVLAEVAEEVGIPRGVVNILTADREVSELLVRHPGVDKVSFTGSSAAGKRIASIMGERIGRYTLELGGKSAAIILDDYDLDTAAQSIAGSACFLSGQVCASLTRILVPEHRHDAFVNALVHHFGAKRTGDPFDPETELGPVAMRRQRDRIEGLIARGVDEGATLALGGSRPKNLNRGFYIAPTVFANVDNSTTIAREEIFGPVLSVIPTRGEDHAIEIANDTVYGLNNSVFTNDLEKAYTIGRELRSGTVGHNGFRADMNVGFGGFKQSGIGREGNVEGLSAYLEQKSLLLDGVPAHLS